MRTGVFAIDVSPFVCLPLPIHRLQLWPADVVKLARWFRADVVGDVRLA
jgi:hypothetical protein